MDNQPSHQPTQHENPYSPNTTEEHAPAPTFPITKTLGKLAFIGVLIAIAIVGYILYNAMQPKPTTYEGLIFNSLSITLKPLCPQQIK